MRLLDSKCIWQVSFGRSLTLWARLSPLELLDPRPVVWTTNAENATLASGGLFIGWTLLIGASMGALHKKMWPWVVLMLTMAVLSMGSIWGGFAMPFLGLNAIMDAIARPLTQPTRYLAVAIVAGAVLAGVWFSSQNRKRQWALVTLMLVESLFFGGLSLKLPTTGLLSSAASFPRVGCCYGLVMQKMESKGEASSFKWCMLALLLRQASASWKLADDRVLGKLRGAGFSQQSTGLKTNKLIELGYRSVLLDRSAIAAEGSRSWSAAPPWCRCGGLWGRPFGPAGGRGPVIRPCSAKRVDWMKSRLLLIEDCSRARPFSASSIGL